MLVLVIKVLFCFVLVEHIDITKSKLIKLTRLLIDPCGSNVNDATPKSTILLL